MPVAIKMTKKSNSEYLQQSFMREMSIMSEMMHPNIVRMYGLVTEGEDVCVCVCVCVCGCGCGCEEVKERRVLGLSVACVRGHMHGCFDTLAAGSCVISVPVLTLWNSNACLICL